MINRIIFKGGRRSAAKKLLRESVMGGLKSGAMTGAILGGAYGAFSSDTTILGGAFAGGILGGGIGAGFKAVDFRKKALASALAKRSRRSRILKGRKAMSNVLQNQAWNPTITMNAGIDVLSLPNLGAKHDYPRPSVKNLINNQSKM